MKFEYKVEKTVVRDHLGFQLISISNEDWMRIQNGTDEGLLQDVFDNDWMPEGYVCSEFCFEHPKHENHEGIVYMFLVLEPNEKEVA